MGLHWRQESNLPDPISSLNSSKISATSPGMLLQPVVGIILWSLARKYFGHLAKYTSGQNVLVPELQQAKQTVSQWNKRRNHVYRSNVHRNELLRITILATNNVLSGIKSLMPVNVTPHVSWKSVLNGMLLISGRRPPTGLVCWLVFLRGLVIPSRVYRKPSQILPPLMMQLSN